VVLSVFARLFLEIFEIHFLPESALVIIMGVVIGLFVWAADEIETFEFDNEIFFLVLIPPIIFESGYHMDRPSFFENVGLILAYALIGTALLAGFMGGVLYWAKDTYNVPVEVVETLTFGSLIAAVDPVAVISIFHEMHVNETLHILVFGESLLNDAISIVLYNVFLSLDGVEFTWDIPFLAFVKFLYVAIGGLLFGIITGLFTAIFLRFIRNDMHLHVVEALVVVTMGWLSFLFAETLLMSGIVSCMFAGITINRYAYENFHPTSKVTIDYVIYILSGTTETIIFLFLGMQSVFTPFALAEGATWDNTWDSGTFVVLTICLILPFRFIMTYSMGYYENTRRIEKIKDEDFLIIAYGGLRGAIAFALAWELPRRWPARTLMVNTVIVCIWFTVFVQGGTIGPLIRYFRVRTQSDHEPSLSEKVLPRVFPHVTNCMKEIYGKHRAGWLVKKAVWVDKKIEQLILREKLTETELKEALTKADHPQEEDKLEEETLKNFTKATRMYKGPIGKAPDVDIGAALMYPARPSFTKEERLSISGEHNRNSGEWVRRSMEGPRRSMDRRRSKDYNI